MKDSKMILILYLESCLYISSFTQLIVVHCVSEWLSILCQWPWQTADTALVCAGHTKLYSSQLVL